MFSQVKDVGDLKGEALNFAVATALGEDYRATTEWDGIGMEYPAHLYSVSWDQAGPLIESAGIRWNKKDDQYYAWIGGHDHIDPLHEPMLDLHQPISWDAFQYGDTLLVACMRCFVQYKYGDYISVPEELLALAA